MTREEARRRAVEAAVKAVWGDCWNELDDDTQVSALADGHAHIAAYERAMADAGWRMVRVVEKIDIPDIVAVPKSLKAGEMAHISAVGWNACRDAMLDEAPTPDTAAGPTRSAAHRGTSASRRPKR